MSLSAAEPVTATESAGPVCKGDGAVIDFSLQQPNIQRRQTSTITATGRVCLSPLQTGYGDAAIATHTRTCVCVYIIKIRKERLQDSNGRHR